MHAESIEATSFIFPMGKYEFFFRMSFGLKSAPRTFQRTMRRMLGYIKVVKILLDDILVATETKEEYLNISAKF